MANNNPSGLWHDKDWLREQRANGLTTYQIADLAGCSRATVEHEMHRIGLLVPRERKEPPPPQYIAPVVDDEPDEEAEPVDDPLLDCLDCPLERGSCDGCAALYRAQEEMWVRG